MKRIRAALLDFDGTIVKDDLTSKLAEFNGKRDESDALNAEFQSGRLLGIDALVARTNLLAGITLEQVEEMLSAGDFLMPGAHELFAYFKDQAILTILASGSMMPILHHYQRILSIDHIVGSKPTMSGNVITGMSAADAPQLNFKVREIAHLLTELDIRFQDTVAIGDSPADKGMLLHAGVGIAINPVGNIADYADYVIGSDLREAVSILRQL